jgi:uncharacterized protein (TIGR02147 family)
MVQNILLAELKSRQGRNPSYSLRSFAKGLGVSPGYLSALISGKKKLTIRQATHLSAALDLSPSAKRQLLFSIAPHLSEEVELESRDLQILQEDEFTLLSEWYHFAILNLAKINKASSNPKQLAKRLGISDIQAIDAIRRLERLGYIKLTKGKINRLAKPLRTTTDVPSTAIRKYHKQNLDLAKEKIDSIPLEKREFSSITMCTSLSKLSRAKKMINEFKERLCGELEAGSQEEVYTLAIQLFPITNMEDN